MSLRLFLGLALGLGMAGGCQPVRVRETRLRNALADARERAERARGLSAPAGALVDRHGLLDLAANRPGEAARALEARLAAQPEPDGALALAELTYDAALAVPAEAPRAAMAWYRDAATLAALALADPCGTRPDRAVAIHNGALARLIRTAQAEAVAQGTTWRRVLAEAGLALHGPGAYLDPERIVDLHVAADFRVQGLQHVFRAPGLGVPLVAHRLADPLARASDDPRDAFLPREVRVGATAILRPGGGLAGSAWRHQVAALDLCAPFGSPTIAVDDQTRLTLAADRSTPLAAQVANRQLATLEWLGLLEPSFLRPGAGDGLYMLRPYEPGKIPVVFVHGLVSSPRAWVQTVNELRNTPELAARYQFWVFLYPTGLPIPASAARLRGALAEARQQLDPGGGDPAFDRMVVVGHSMGGLLAKMLAQESGPILWNATIAVPPERFRAPSALGRGLDDLLIYRPVPSVRRLIFIASPHRGSPLANDLLGRVVSSLIRGPNGLAENLAEIESLNGPDVIARELRTQPLNAIGNLRTDSPILAALQRIPIDPTVAYHSIIPLIGAASGTTDGVVAYESSHLEGAASERIVAGTHFAQGSPEVTEELRRILLEHLAAADPVSIHRR